MQEAIGSHKHDTINAAAIRNSHGNEEYTARIKYHGGYGGAPRTNTPEEWFEEVLRKELGPHPRATLYAEYGKLSDRAKARFAKKYGVDQHAVPKVGQGVTTFSQFDVPGWKPLANNTWNFHHATNILASGADYITLENYRYKGPSNWFFDLVGPASRGQSFHETHGDSDQFGTHYSTLVVQPGHMLYGRVKGANVPLVKSPPARHLESTLTANEIARLDQGTKIIVFEKHPTWWRVQVRSGTHAQKDGWLMSKFFEVE